MTEAEERYDAVASRFTTLVEAIGEDGWSFPSPCNEWSAADVVVHVIDTHYRVLSNVNEGEPPQTDRSGDLAAQWRSATTEMAAALADPERAATICNGMFGEQPFEALIGRLVCTDTLIHTWDLAQATGQNSTLDVDLVAAAFSFLEPIDEAIRRPGGFASKIEPAPDADEQTRFLNFCGRQG